MNDITKLSFIGGTVLAPLTYATFQAATNNALQGWKEIGEISLLGYAIGAAFMIGGSAFNDICTSYLDREKIRKPLEYLGATGLNITLPVVGAAALSYLR